jgi:hypothetical protein
VVQEVSRITLSGSGGTTSRGNHGTHSRSLPTPFPVPAGGGVAALVADVSPPTASKLSDLTDRLRHLNDWINYFVRKKF